MHPGERLKQRREKLGFSMEHLAESAGMTLMSYWDVEAYPDEFRTMLDLSKAQKICETLHIGLFEILALDPEVPADLLNAPRPEDIRDRATLIKSRREALGLTQDQLADRVGYHQELVTEAEMDPSTLGIRCLDVLVDLAKELRLPLAALTTSKTHPS